MQSATETAFKKNELDDPLKGLTLPQRRKEEAKVINQGQLRQ
jgi:hypothetical protein